MTHGHAALPLMGEEHDALPPFQSYIRLESIDPDTNRFRFFILQWQPTLWNERALVRIWGRLGTPGQSRLVCSIETEPPTTALHRLLRRRLAHGYAIVAWQ